MHKVTLALYVAALTLVVSFPVIAQGNEGMRHEFFETVSNDFHAAFLGVALTRDLWTRHPHQWKRSLRAADALIVSAAATAALKTITRSPRPDTRALNSFPSGHTSSAFAVATVQAAYNPNEAAYWYAGAAFIGASRVELRRHRWEDVIGGAAVGYLAGRWSLQSGGLLLAPLFGDGPGITVAGRF